uniref:Wnt inhibitory factor n=1 Tax=Oopsacas minuta TaxID=111878 RepID=A0A2H4G8J9_9METZ|nr:Wnt inhibitory factor [Oopsacas minuta]
MKVFIYIFVYLLFCSCFYTLDVYIEPEESAKVLGPIDENFYIIQDDIPSVFLKSIQDVIGSLRAIPACVHKLTLKWVHDGPHMLRYDIRRIISLNDNKLTVTTNIESQGFVPREKSDLTLNFNCIDTTSQQTYTEYFYIEIYLLSDVSQLIYGSPVAMWIQKKCGSCDSTYLNYIPDLSILGIARSPDRCGGCENEGRCARLPGGYSKCKCKKGYTGVRCELPRCKPDCVNGGTCIGPQKCSCPPLFRGPMCEYPVCNPICKNGGYCNSTNVCSCPPGFSGSACGIAPTVVITSGPVDTTVYSMQAVKLQCRAKGKPRPKFRWLDTEERPILPDGKRYRHLKVVVVKSQGYSDLWIYGADESDQGTYHCIAENEYSMDRASATLTVIPYTGGDGDLEDIFTGSGSGSGDYWPNS